MICLNVSTRVVAAERCTASSSAIRSYRRHVLSQTRYLYLGSHRTPSARWPALSSRSAIRTVSSPSLPRISDQKRSYVADTGQNTNTIQGTIGKGASGIVEEAHRAKEKLQAPDHLNEKEKMIFEKLDNALGPVKLEVQDISGGCGSMYGIEIVSERFRGLNMLKQQRLVNQVLGEEIKGWHGVQLKTRVP